MKGRLNLMPWREQRRASVVRRFQITLVATLVVALCGVMLLDRTARSRLARQAQVVATQQVAVERLDASLRQIDQLRETRDALSAEQAAVSALDAARAQLPGLFLALEQAMPEGARLTEVGVEDGHLRLTGLAASASVVARLMRGLEQVAMVRDLQLVHLRRHGQGDEFLLAARLLAGES
ncbi:MULTISPECIES: PilN domain-containing protein [unclassified Pseudomonas]|uniref:PilN domain-containing protein n=1 Tax=unclassified Pseudomonas TaxID=196821 RepID=UPI000C88A026|nr:MULTISPECIES: PilN domain-containing protein [unclassified Pseudomonas]PNA02583.1 fimbrial protein [Pseudomonas sp. FW305-42]PNA26915.1 fimbrial protein [Pseudomonas sp. MPR-R1B]PNB27713.1 fimbrial protein [Pseudomonas sp. DP16D-E2]PNB44241.1 fimbrial protein [Pseudomonas sp. FW305-17]PNB63229.1 fimbrial protein [Pseudomonas sp. GW531-E2]